MSEHETQMPIPQITLDLAKICQVVPPDSFRSSNGLVVAESILGRKNIIGLAYAIPLENAKSRAMEVGMNLDDYLAAQIAVYLNRLRDRKSPMLIWYAAVQNLFFLYITSKRDCRWMTIENSYDSHSQDTVIGNAEPFMYLDGKGGIFRTYLLHPGVEGDDNLLFDMGAIFPLRVGNTDGSRYEQILKSPLNDDNLDYNPIPGEREFVLEWKGQKVLVERAFCRLGYRGMLTPVAEDSEF